MSLLAVCLFVCWLVVCLFVCLVGWLVRSFSLLFTKIQPNGWVRLFKGNAVLINGKETGTLWLIHSLKPNERTSP